MSSQVGLDGQMVSLKKEFLKQLVQEACQTVLPEQRIVFSQHQPAACESHHLSNEHDPPQSVF